MDRNLLMPLNKVCTHFHETQNHQIILVDNSCTKCFPHRLKNVENRVKLHLRNDAK